MTENDRFEEFVRSALDEWDVPAVPRAAMWSRIEAARRFRRPRRSARRQWLGWSAALAAMLVLGIGLGRVSLAREKPAAPIARQPATAVPAPSQPAQGGAYTLAAIEHMNRAEVLLTAINSGEFDAQLNSWAKEMLVDTQLLMDSPAANNPRIANLLQDLELVLAQIAATPPGARAQQELDLINEGIQETGVLPRLRATASASRMRPVGT